MEGDRPITVRELVTTVSPTGAVQRGYGREAGGEEFKAWAKREDRGGRIVEAGEQRGGEWSTIFTIRAPLGIRIRPDWQITDEHGDGYTIEAVVEVPGTRGDRLRLYAVAQPTT